MNVDMAKDPLGIDQKGKKVFLKDIWPSNKEIGEFIAKNVTKQIFTKKYADVFKGDANWRKITVKGGLTYAWDDRSTYVQNPPYFEGMEKRQRRSKISSTRACWRCCSTRSPPTTFRRPARSRKRARPANICAITRSVRRTSTNTARAAAIIRS